MDAEKVDIYEACDKAIQEMNRKNLKAFSQLKLAKWDEIHIIRTVKAVYTQSVKRAKRKYYEVAFEAYVLGALMCDIDPVTAHRMAEKAIDEKFVDDVLKQTDFVTLYRFDTEAERKWQRLAETLEVAQNRNAEIDRALKQWSQQLGQYAINFTDYAVIQAFDDAEIMKVQWISQKDGRVCHECKDLDGKIFPIDEVPKKPHVNCRCRVAPVMDRKKE